MNSRARLSSGLHIKKDMFFFLRSRREQETANAVRFVVFVLLESKLGYTAGQRMKINEQCFKVKTFQEMETKNTFHRTVANKILELAAHSSGASNEK